MTDTCPSCKARLHADAVLCVNCGYHLQKGTHISTQVNEVEPADFQASRDPNAIDDFFLPILWRYVNWFAYAFVIGLVGSTVLWLASPLFADAPEQAATGFWVLIPIVILSLQFAMVVGIVGAVAKTFSLLLNDSPFALLLVLGISVVFGLFYLLNLAWDWGFKIE